VKIILRRLVLPISLMLICLACGSHQNSADRQFVAELVPHHQLGVQLIDHAILHASDVRLKRLVFEMSSYHHADLHNLEHWKMEWGVTLSKDFPGHLSNTELTMLEEQDGVDYDIYWLGLMIKHHDGALMIADQLLSGSSNFSTRSLAFKLQEIQTAEILEMKDLHQKLCSQAKYSKTCNE
jgi:uncharacterized protein (DUF305 family)